jgi:hypothetical protein
VGVIRKIDVCFCMVKESGSQFPDRNPIFPVGQGDGGRIRLDLC